MTSEELLDQYRYENQVLMLRLEAADARLALVGRDKTIADLKTELAERRKEIARLKASAMDHEIVGQHWRQLHMALGALIEHLKEANNDRN